MSSFLSVLQLERVIFVVWSNEDKAVYEYVTFHNRYIVFASLIYHYRRLIPEYFPLAENPDPAEATTGTAEPEEEASPLRE